jgi:LysM repeat protein
MQKLIILIFIIFFISGVGFTQNSDTLPLSDSLVIADSCYFNPDSAANNLVKNDSIFEICWNTTCIIGGWTKADSSLKCKVLAGCDSTAPFIMPVQGILLRGYKSYHSGWDIKADAGTPVKAAMEGRVRYAHYCSGYGNLAIIRHASGLEIYYSHLSKLKVKPDQYVEAGDTVGLVGATGHATTNHLHMEFRIFDHHFDISKIYTQNDSIIYLWKMNQTPSVAPVSEKTDYYTVKKGDTLSKIARNYGTSVSNLLKLNNLKYNSILSIGQKIRIN